MTNEHNTIYICRTFNKLDTLNNVINFNNFNSMLNNIHERT